jgi:hypothetical protein
MCAAQLECNLAKRCTTTDAKMTASNINAHTKSTNSSNANHATTSPRSPKGNPAPDAIPLSNHNNNNNNNNDDDDNPAGAAASSSSAPQHVQQPGADCVSSLNAS